MATLIAFSRNDSAKDFEIIIQPIVEYIGLREKSTSILKKEINP